MKQTMIGLREWRDALQIDTPIITREAIKGIVAKILEYPRVIIMYGKCHEMKVNIDDLFPIDWEELIVSWRNKKAFRDTDILIGEIEE